MKSHINTNTGGISLCSLRGPHQRIRAFRQTPETPGAPKPSAPAKDTFFSEDLGGRGGRWVPRRDSDKVGGTKLGRDGEGVSQPRDKGQLCSCPHSKSQQAGPVLRGPGLMATAQSRQTGVMGSVGNDGCPGRDVQPRPPTTLHCLSISAEAPGNRSRCWWRSRCAPGWLNSPGADARSNPQPPTWLMPPDPQAPGDLVLPEGGPPLPCDGGRGLSRARRGFPDREGQTSGRVLPASGL